MFTRLKKTTALVAGGALLAVPTAVLVSAPAHADVERHGSCGAGTFDFSVDREGGGFEVSLDLDRVGAGTNWKVVLKHDGKRYFKGTRTADQEGDIDVERFRDNSNGKDVFRFTAKRANGAAGCGGKITLR